MMKIYPPRKALEFPLTTHQVCKILGISKSTFFRWEAAGLIGHVSRDVVDGSVSRCFEESDLLALFECLREMRYKDGRLKYPELATLSMGDKITLNGFEIDL